MGVHDAIRAYNGVIGFLNKNTDKINIGAPKKKYYRAKEEYLNDIFIKFGKEFDIKMTKNNSKNYKGTFNPCMSNCIKIQSNWGNFVHWIFENYKVKSKN